MARMVDVHAKPDVPRRAVATGTIRLRLETVRAIRSRRVEKGDPIAAAEIAGLQAIKSTWQTLPHCHPIPLTSASVEFDVRTDRGDPGGVEGKGSRATAPLAPPRVGGLPKSTIRGESMPLRGFVWRMRRSSRYRKCARPSRRPWRRRSGS